MFYLKLGLRMHTYTPICFQTYSKRFHTFHQPHTCTRSFFCISSSQFSCLPLISKQFMIRHFLYTSRSPTLHGNATLHFWTSLVLNTPLFSSCPDSKLRIFSNFTDPSSPLKSFCPTLQAISFPCLICTVVLFVWRSPLCLHEPPSISLVGMARGKRNRREQFSKGRAECGGVRKITTE